MNLEEPGALVPLGGGVVRPFTATCPWEVTTGKVETCLPTAVPLPSLPNPFPTSQLLGPAWAIKGNLYLRLLQREPVQRVREGLHHVHRHRELLIQVEGFSPGKARVKLALPETCIQQRAGAM